MDDVTVVSRTELEAPEETAGVSLQRAFEAGDTLVGRATVAGGVTTGWHHSGDRHVHGRVLGGHALLEYGPGEGEAVALAAGDFVYVPPRTIRRVVNSSHEEWEAVIGFVGSGPPTVAVDGPEPDAE